VCPTGPAAFGGPLEVLELLTPVMSATTMLLSLVSERLWHTLPGSPYFSSLERCLLTLCIILFGALLAFFMVWAEYQVRLCVCVCVCVLCELCERMCACAPATSGLRRFQRHAWDRCGPALALTAPFPPFVLLPHARR
jgi:hypothetical protein